MVETIIFGEQDLSQIHLLGIGGAGQNALAEMLLDMGYSLSGSDLKLSATTEGLARRGVTIFEGQRAENLKNTTIVITTAAAGEHNPELQEARRRGLPVMQNAEVVGQLMNQKRLLAIAGTHGKTTTTGLVAFLLERLDLDPTYYIGGVPFDLGRAGKAGKGQFAVVEADEYARRFLQYQPEAAIITNIDHDHLDYYETYPALEAAFTNFARNLKPNGSLYVCYESGLAADMAENISTVTRVQRYGFSPFDRWSAIELEPNELGGYSYKLTHLGRVEGIVKLRLAGVHNVLNSVAALAMLIELLPEVEIATLCELAGQYRGTGRRFEVKGEVRGITVVDDYAHHPTEIKATLAAARARYPHRRLVALFQPHTYSRTKALLADFAAAFEDADVVALMEIFAARETDTLGVSSADILEKMNHSGKLSAPLTHADAAQTLTGILKEGDVLLTLGAGDVWKIGEQVLGNAE